jgi:D-alanyl-D-alanine carboxypeptidase
MSDVYVYRARYFDTPSAVAQRYRVTEAELRAANPQWKNRVIIFFKEGEEVIFPYKIPPSINDLYVDSGRIYKQRGADWYPPKPNFKSPSSPLSALLAKLGNPKYTVTNPGKYHSPIKFTDGWDGKNISKVAIPQLVGVPFYEVGGTKGSGNISFYTKAHSAVQKLFKAWEDDGLLPKILTFEGSFNPRVIKSGTTPSNHSFGTAFDINGSWNREGSAAAGIGKKGCLLELVPRANELGFYWGGFYKDAMHFEYAKL